MCFDKLLSDMTKDCGDKPKVGLETTAIIFNRGDIDFTATTFGDSLCSTFALKAGTTGYKLDSYKNLNSFTSTFTQSSDVLGGFSHSYSGSMKGGTDLENARYAKILGNGEFVLCIITKYGVGTENQYKFIGLEHGLEASEIVVSTAENDGRITFVLSTPETAKESDLYTIYSTGDVAENDADFNALFAE